MSTLMLEENTTINAHIARNLYRKLVLHTLSINILLNQMVETDPSMTHDHPLKQNTIFRGELDF